MWLGFCHMFGRDVKENPAMAAKRWESAAGRGDADQTNHLGFCFEHGLRINVNLFKPATYNR
jgi:TPR repeat protein